MHARAPSGWTPSDMQSDGHTSFVDPAEAPPLPPLVADRWLPASSSSYCLLCPLRLLLSVVLRYCAPHWRATMVRHTGTTTPRVKSVQRFWKRMFRFGAFVSGCALMRPTQPIHSHSPPPPLVRAERATASQQQDHQPASLIAFAETEGVECVFCVSFQCVCQRWRIITNVSDLTWYAPVKTAKPPIEPRSSHRSTQKRQHFTSVVCTYLLTHFCLFFKPLYILRFSCVATNFCEECTFNITPPPVLVSLSLLFLPAFLFNSHDQLASKNIHAAPAPAPHPFCQPFSSRKLDPLPVLCAPAANDMCVFVT